MATVSPANQEAVDAWNGVLFDRFLEYRHIFTAALGQHGKKGMELHPPPEGGRALDIGCGFGDTTQQLAALVGADGEAVGIDSSDRFIELAEQEGVPAVVARRDGPFGDYSQAPPEEQPDPSHVIEIALEEGGVHPDDQGER